jgi:hypothetical protein
LGGGRKREERELLEKGKEKTKKEREPKARRIQKFFKFM